MAETLELTDHTSVQRRIETLQEENHASAQPLDEVPSAVDSMDKLRGSYDSFLTPLSIHELVDPIGPCVSETDQRCSDERVLAMPLDDYLELLEWTARQVAPGKWGSTLKNSPPILERLGLDQSSRCELFATDRAPDGVQCNSSSLPPGPSNERYQKIPKEIHWQP